MSTIINTPPATNSSDSGLGIVLGVIIAVALLVLFFIYGLPYMRGNSEPKTDSVNVNVQLPTTQTPPATTNP